MIKKNWMTYLEGKGHQSRFSSPHAMLQLTIRARSGFSSGVSANYLRKNQNSERFKKKTI